MATVDTLVTRYTLDDSDYQQGANSVANSTSRIGKAMGDLKGIIAGLGLGALAMGAAQAFGSVVNAGAEFEAQTKALSLYSDEVNTTEMMLKRLGEVAKLPGLGNIEAIQSAVKLLAGGFDFTLAERSMLAFGNALAAAGRGKEDLDGVIMALTQIAAKGAVSAEEINQIAERVPQIREAMKGAFGTANTEQIQKMGITAEQFIIGIIAQLEKLPKATSGMKNTLSNLGDFFGLAMADIGMGLNKYLIGPLEEVGRFGEYLKSNNVFASIGESFGKLFGTGESNSSPLVTMLSYLVSTLEEMPSIIKKIGLVFGQVAQGFMDAFTAIYNRIATTPMGRLMRMDVMDFTDVMAGGIGGPVFANNTININRRAQQRLEEFGNYNPAPGTKAEGGGFTGMEQAPVDKELQKQTSYLDQIAKNTDPGRNSILGGGSLAAKGVTPTELSAMGGRDELSDLARAMGRYMDKRAAQMAADMVQFNNPLIGGR